jgi:hypothetical protein
VESEQPINTGINEWRIVFYTGKSEVPGCWQRYLLSDIIKDQDSFFVLLSSVLIFWLHDCHKVSAIQASCLHSRVGKETKGFLARGLLSSSEDFPQKTPPSFMVHWPELGLPKFQPRLRK